MVHHHKHDNKNAADSGFESYVSTRVEPNNEFSFFLALAILLGIMALVFRPWITLLKNAKKKKQTIRAKHDEWIIRTEQFVPKNYNEVLPNESLYVSMADDDNIVDPKGYDEKKVFQPHKYDTEKAFPTTTDYQDMDNASNATPMVEDGGCGCLDAGAETVLRDIENIDESGARQVAQMIGHLSTRQPLSGNTPAFNTSILQVSPLAQRRRRLFGTSAAAVFASDATRNVETSCSDDEDDVDDDATIFLNHTWDDLPENARLAATTLGYNKKMWDNDEESPISRMKWEDLTVLQRVACEELGFKKAIWDHEPTPEPVDAVDYNTLRWNELPSAALVAARSLGFDQRMWDSDQVPEELLTLRWSQLSNKQRAACEVLGVNEEKWEGGYSSDDDKQDLHSRSWKDLPERAKDAARKLGYTRELWDQDESPPCGEKHWKELSREEKRACKILGFSKETWETEFPKDDKPRLRNMAWKHLPKEAKTAAQVLGLNKRTWESRDATTSLRTLPWEQLQPKQQVAALYLGYDATKWNNMERSADTNAKGEADMANYPVCGWKWLGAKQSTEQSFIGMTRPKSPGPLALAWKEVPSLLKKEDNSRQEGARTFARMFVVDHDSERLLRIGLATSFIGALPQFLSAIISALVINFMGPQTFLAWAISSFLLTLCELVVGGIVELEQILCDRALDIENYFFAGQCVQLTALITFLTTLPFYTVLIVFIDNILSAFQFGDEVAALAKLYMPYAVAAHLVEGCVVERISRLLKADGRGTAMIYLNIGTHFLQMISVVLLLCVFGSGSVGHLGALEVVCSGLHAIILCSLCVYYGWLSKYSKGIFAHFSLGDQALIQSVLKMAAPLTVGNLLANGEWLIMTFLAISMGPAETAAWMIFQVLKEMLEKFPSGISSTASVLMVQYMERGQAETAKLFAYRSLVYSAATSTVMSLVVFLARTFLVDLFTADDTLFELVSELIPLLCLGSIVAVVGNNAYTILETQHRTKLAILVYFVGAFFISIPLALILVLGCRFCLESMVMSSAMGNSIVAFALLTIVFITNWSKMSRRLVLRTAQEAQDVEAVAQESTLSKSYKAASPPTSRPKSLFQ